MPTIVSSSNVSQNVSYSSGVASGFTVPVGSGSNRYAVSCPVIDDIGFVSWEDDGQSINGTAMSPLVTQVDDEATTRAFGLDVSGMTGNQTYDSTLFDQFDQDPIGIVSVVVLADVDVGGTPVDNVGTPTTGTDDDVNGSATSQTGDRVIFFAVGRAFSPTDCTPNGYNELWQNFNTELFSTGGDADGAATVTLDADISSAAMIGHVGIFFNVNAASGGSVELVVQDIAVSIPIDNLALTQASTLVIADMLIGTQEDNVALVQHNVLSMNDLNVGMVLENINLIVGIPLVVNDAFVGVGIEAPTLIQGGVLVVGELSISVTIDGVALTQENVLAMQDLLVGILMDNLALTQKNTLVVEDMFVPIRMDNIRFPGFGIGGRGMITNSDRINDVTTVS